MGYKLQATNNICWVCSKKGETPTVVWGWCEEAYVRPSKHGIDSMVINLGGIAPEGFPIGSHSGSSLLLNMMKHDTHV